MKEDKNIFAQGKDNFLKHQMVALLVVAMAVAIIYVAWMHNKDFRRKEIALTQYQMMTTAKATAISIQEFINNAQANAYAIANDTLTQQGLSENNITSAIKREIKETYNAHKKDIDTIYLLNSKGVILHRHPFWKNGKDRRGNSYADKPGVSHVLKYHEPYISDVFYTGSDKFTISVLSPVQYNNKFVGIVRLLINISTISERFVKPIKVGAKGYAQLLDNRGMLLYHPESEYIDKNIMATIKEQLPDSDWSELEDIVRRMTLGEEGFGFYYSVWWTEKEFTGRVKKLTSFTPIRFGTHIWSFGLVMSYDEITGPINRNTILTYSFAGLLLLLFSAGGLVFYKTQRRKAVLEAIAESADALRESEEKLRAIFETIPDPVVMYDTQGYPKYLNPAFTQIFGWSLDELRDKRIPFVPDDQKEITSTKIKELYELDKPVRIESKRLTKEGLLLEVHISAALTKDPTGEPVGMVVNLTDITERKRLEDQLHKSQKLEAIGILAGGMAHDFNNLLSIIMGNISMTKDDVKPEHGVTDFLNEAEEASLRAQELTKQLITFSKGGAPVKEVGSIGDLAKELINFSISDSNVECKFSIPHDLWLAEFDEGQMKHAIDKMLINAVESMPGGGTIDIRAENFNITAERDLPLPEGKYVKISIRDQGVGIPEEHISLIFDPYFSTKEMGTQKGMGLGLATTYSIINRHDGHITVESEVRVGTTFTLYLPAHEKDVKELALVEITKPERHEVRTGRILLMDDEKSIRKVTKQMLSRLGYDPDFAKDGTEAIEQYKGTIESGKPFDAVILDLTIKEGMGGIDTIKKLMEIDPQVRAIVSSGYSNDPIMTDYRAYGFIGALPKPYTMKDLSETLNKVTEE